MKEIESIKAFEEILSGKTFSELAFQSLDLTPFTQQLLKKKCTNCIFLGCKMDEAVISHIRKDNYIFPELNVPYNVYPNKLYDKGSLYNGFDYKTPGSYEKTLDSIIYQHYLKTGKEAENIKETLARRLHDHSVTDALYDFISNYSQKKIVAIMGGHGLLRSKPDYRQVAKMSKILTEKGYLMLSGGGPGAMEATHLGAWFAGREEQELFDAIEILKKAPRYNDPDWLETAFRVIEAFPLNTSYKSLGIPTWLYGHEPASPFATHIAKYFANSVREEGLLTIAKGGIIFAPGSAGTIQEIFQEITQNHYLSYGDSSPMVFMNKKYWRQDRPVFPVIELMSKRGELKNLDLGIYDEIEEVIEHIEAF